MFESLIQQPSISQQILSKIATQLINKYEIKDFNNLHQFINDLNKVVQQIKLYNQTLQQLFAHQNFYHYKLLLSSHQHSFRIIDFLGKMVKKIFLRPTGENSALQSIKHKSLCEICSNHIQQKNIKQLQKQILDHHQFPLEQLDQSTASYNNEGQFRDQRFATPEQLLLKKMATIQKNIGQRQINLLRCIEDFQNLRSDLIIGIKKRQFDREALGFDLKAYSFQLTKHFLSNLNRIQEKIGTLRRSINAIQDKQTQTNLNNCQQQGLANRNDQASKSQNARAQTDFRKVTDQKNKLEDTCKKYQIELRDLNSRLEAIQIQNKNLRQQLTVQKFKILAKQKSIKNLQKAEQKSKKQQIQNLNKKQLSISNEGLLSGELTNRFIQNYFLTLGKKDDQLAPILKASFKRTLDNFFNHRMSLNLSNFDYKMFGKQQQDEISNKRRKSKKKSMRFQLETDGKEYSRFANKRNSSQNNKFTITSQINHKIITDKLHTFRNSAHKSPPQISAYKKAIIYTEQSGQKKRIRHSKLSSLLLQNKQNDTKNQTQYLVENKYNHTMEGQINQAKISHKRIKKSKLSRNLSQFFENRDINVGQGDIPIIKIKKINVSSINSAAIKQFLFIKDNESKEQIQKNKLNLSKIIHKSKLSFQFLPLENIQKKGKIILNLQEINYLTQFYSLFAKIHIVNPDTYIKLKDCIFSKIDKSKIKQYETKQNLILKKIVSEIVYKHRQCQFSSPLCPHLQQFLKEMQKSINIESIQ